MQKLKAKGAESFLWEIITCMYGTVKESSKFINYPSSYKSIFIGLPCKKHYHVHSFPIIFRKQTDQIVDGHSKSKEETMETNQSQ